MKVEKEIVKKEIILQGVSISRGIAIGKPFFMLPKENNPLEHTISEEEIDKEIKRYRMALQKSRIDIENLQKKFIKNGAYVVADILDAHLEILHDPVITDIVENKIRTTHKNPEAVFQKELKKYKKVFSSKKDVFFQEKMKDITDVSWRVFKHLKPFRKKMIHIEQNSILIANDLIPSDAYDLRYISGFITKQGGYTSHVGIIARAKGIPYVAKVSVEFLQKIDIDTIILDGISGIVIINPKPQTLKKYKYRKKSFAYSYQKMKKHRHLDSVTQDGISFDILSNMDSLEDVDILQKHGAKGVGLFRSEYLILSKRKVPTEKEQFNVYKQIAQKLKTKPFIIRLFDIGGDKNYFFSDKIHQEMNPSLGCRAIRFLMKNKNILDAQLKAILKASVYGNVQILIPFVTEIQEIQYVKSRVKYISNLLKKEGMKIGKIPIGIMIEVPSCVIMGSFLVKEIDFWSVGANDLMQYIIAADRTNPHLNHLFEDLHPAFLKILEKIIKISYEKEKPLYLCGEIASNVKYLPILAGMGIRKFSVPCRSIPEIKYTIASLNHKLTKTLAKKALKLGTKEKIKQLVF